MYLQSIPLRAEKIQVQKQPYFCTAHRIALAHVDEYQCAGSSCSGEIGGDLFSLPCKYYCSGAVKVTVSLGYLLCKCQLHKSGLAQGYNSYAQRFVDYVL